MGSELRSEMVNESASFVSQKASRWIATKWVFGLTLAIAFAASANPLGTNPSKSKLEISQRDVAELVLTRSDRSQETNLTADLPRLEYANAVSAFDWGFSLEQGYELTKAESFSGLSNAKDETLRTSLLFGKNWITGTKTTLLWNRNSVQSEFFPNQINRNQPPQQTQDIFGLRLEQALWRNAFGRGDRANVRSAELKLEATTITRANDLQTNVLEGLRRYWQAFVAEENFKEALASRERYVKLAENLRRKSSFGYSSPGEYPQVQAELEARNQNAKNESTNYLRALDNLLLYLNVPVTTEVVFKVDKSVPPPPELKAVALNELRRMKSQDLKVRAAEELVTTADSLLDPQLTLLGDLYGNGVEESSSDSLPEALSGSRPRYYLGLRFEFTFGSGSQSENLANKQIGVQLEKLRQDRLRREIEAELNHQERKVIANYAVVKSSEQQVSFREKAMQEVSRAYTQGRTDIRNVIETTNAFSISKIQLSRAIGDYQITLAELSALRDELIPAPTEVKP